MKTIELSAAIASAPVQENLKNFAGLDAQNALGLMTPERLAAVAGEKMGLANFKSGLLNTPSELSTNIKEIAEYVYQNTKENTSFSYIVSCEAVYQATGYLSSGKKYGVITITCYIKERNATFFIINGVVKQNTIGA